MALACSEETIPRALVNEKWVSAFEFRMIIRNPSCVFGGLTIGNMIAHSRAKEIERPTEPLSAKAAILALLPHLRRPKQEPRRQSRHPH